MDAISTLGLDINTTGVRRGAAEVDAFKASTDRAAQGATKLEGKARDLGRQFEMIGRFADQLALKLAAAFAVEKILEYANAWQQATNQMRLVTDSTNQLNNALQGVFQLSQQTFTSFEGNADLFVRLQRYAGDLVGGQQNALRLTKTIAEEISLAGVSAQTATMGLIQFSQGLARGVLQGQDLKAVMEDIPTLGQAIAQGMGVPLGQLKTLGEQGKITAREIIDALTRVSASADEEFKKLTPSLSQAGQKIINALIEAFGTQGGGVFDALARGMSTLADHMHDLLNAAQAVGAAMIVAFAPSVVEAFTGAVMAATEAMLAFAASNPITTVLALVVGLVVAMRQFGDQMTLATLRGDELARHTAGIAEDVRSQITEAHVTLRDEVDATFQVLGEKLGELPGQARDFFNEVAREWNDLWSPAAQDQRNKGLLDSIMDGLRGIVDAIGQVIDNVFSAIANAASGIFTSISDSVGGWLHDMGLDQLLAMRQVAGGGTARAQDVQIMPAIQDRAAQIATDREAQRIAAQQEQERRRVAAETEAANRQAADRLAKQTESHRQLFDEMQAELTLNDRQFHIYQETEKLLHQFPDYYRQQARGAADVAARAHEIAEADAQALDNMRRKLAVFQQMKQAAKDQAAIEAQIAAAAVGANELDVVTRTQDLLRQNVEMYEAMGKAGADVARADAERQVANERILDAMTKQAERARSIAEAPLNNLLDNFNALEDKFWQDFSNSGDDAIKGLGDSFRKMFKQLQADILRAIFDPVFQAMRNAIAQSFNLALPGAGVSLAQLSQGGGGFASLANLFAQSGGQLSPTAAANLGGGGAGGGLAGFPNLGSLGNSGLAILAATALGQKGGSSNLMNLGFLNGGGALSTLAANAINVVSPTLAAMVGNTLSQVFNPANSIGGMIGSGLSSLLGLNKGGAGGTIGGIIGSFLGPIGSAVGSFIGSMFGPGPTANDTLLALDKSGNAGAISGKPTDQTTQAIQGVAQAIQKGLSALDQLGGKTSGFISTLSLSARRDKSGYWYTDAQGNTTKNQIGSIGDAKDLANQSLNKLLSNTSFDNPVIDAVAKAMAGANKDFDTTVAVLGKLQQVLPATNAATSQWKSALDTLTSTFADLKQSTADVAGVAAQLDDAFAAAKTALAKQFSDSISDAILSIKSPLTKQFDDLLKTQVQRLEDAAALGVPADSVKQLNALELKAFIEQAAGSAAAFQDLAKVFTDLVAAAKAAGQNVQPIIDAFNQAQQGVASAFDKDIGAQLDQLSNPTLAALKALLQTQKDRLAQAQAIGGNIVAVDRLNALEMQKFFEGLTDQQKLALGDYLGMIQDFTGQIAVVLSKLGDELSARIDNLDQMRTDLTRQSDAMRTLGQNIADLRQSLADKYGALTPKEGVAALRARFGDLYDQARAGNDSALQALPQVAQQLIDASRALYGSTTTFRGDYDFVQQVLGEMQSLATGRADDLASQAQTLVEQRDLLIDIRNILQSPDPNLAALQLDFEKLDSNQAIIAALLSQYLQLTASEAGQNLDLTALYQAALNAAQTPQAASSLPTSTASTPANTTSAGSAATTTPQAVSVTNDPTPEMVATLIDVTNNGLSQMVEAQEDNTRQLRSLISTIAANGVSAKNTTAA